MNQVDQILLNTIMGVVTGVIASYIFLTYYLKRMRPKIKISERISKLNYNGETNYFFKFINSTDTDIFDVSIELVLYKPVGEVNGTNLIGKEIDLVDNFSAYIPARSKSDQHALHAIRIRTLTNLEEEWADDSAFLQLTIIAKHSLSGLNKVFHQHYRSKDCILTKKFKSGDDLTL